MSTLMMGRAFAALNLPPDVKLLLIVMANYASDEGFCRVERQTLLRLTGLTPAALVTAAQTAATRGLLILEPAARNTEIIAYRFCQQGNDFRGAQRLQRKTSRKTDRKAGR